MKRLGWIFAGALVVAVLTAAVGVDFGRGGVAVGPRTAAADDIVPGGNVCIAVPILTGQARGACPEGQVEVKNDQAGGGAIVYYLKLALKLINTLIGVMILMFLTIAGVQYITSVGDPSRVKAAKNRVQNSIIALVLYMLMFAILNFLVPGGIL